MQDSIDLFLGNYQVDEDEGVSHRSPLTAVSDWRFTVLLSILLGSVFMFFTTVVVPSGESADGGITGGRETGTRELL